MPLPLFHFTACQEPLGMADNVIPFSVLTVSTWLSADKTKNSARLHGTSAWCAKTNDIYQFLEVDLGDVHLVTGLAVQGNPTADEWVTGYALRYTTDRIEWLYERKDGTGDKGIKV